MCSFGAREDWREGRSVFSSYIYVDTRNDQYRLLNPTPLDCIVGYIMEDYVGDRTLKRLPQRSLKIFNGSISS